MLSTLLAQPTAKKGQHIRPQKVPAWCKNWSHSA